MSPTLSRLLIRVYPHAWRVRYGREFQALLESLPGTSHTVLNIVFSAIRERISPTQGAVMTQPSITLAAITRKPTAFLPLTFSLLALSLLLTAVAMNHGVVHDADEGAIAHLWQLLMAAQAPILLAFAVKWLRRTPRRAMQVMALQAAAVSANLAAVFFLT